MAKSGSMSDTKSIFINLVLALQFCLGFWQIVKLTVFGAFTRGFLAWLISLLPLGELGSRLSPTYSRLKKYDGFLFIKEATCHVTTAADQPTAAREMPHEICNQFELSYLGECLLLERREGNRLFLNGNMSYYITDCIWNSLLQLKKVASETVFVKGHKELWAGVLAGGVMDLFQVLDCMILENNIIQSLENMDWLIPVNLSVSEEKLLKGFNLGALFLQTKKQVHWFLPTLCSFTVAVLEFSTLFRVWLYDKVNFIFFHAMHPIFDRLPLLTRMQLYILSNFAKPSNDIQWKVVKGDISVVIGGGARVHVEGATLVQPDPDCIRQAETRRLVKFKWGEFYFSSRFDVSRGKCHTEFITSGWAWDFVYVDCNMDEYMKMITFLYCIAKNSSGSLKTCGPKNKVLVRGFRESVICYAKSGFPPVYELKLNNAIVK